MRKSFIITLAATASLAAMSHHCAAAMAPGAASALAAADASLAEPVVNVCGTNGCVRVQTQRIVKRRLPPPLQRH